MHNRITITIDVQRPDMVSLPIGVLNQIKRITLEALGRRGNEVRAREQLRLAIPAGRDEKPDHGRYGNYSHGCPEDIE